MLATRSLVASTILAAAAALTVAPLGSAAADDPKPKPPSTASVSDTAPKPSRDAVAEAAAANVIAAKVPQLYLSRYDKAQARKTLRSGQLRFVPYERTYRGLPVVGGDFVVVVDGDGNVVHTSVAQTGKVSLPDVRASVTATTARTKSAGKVNNARLGRSQLVVLQRGSRSDLAWRTTATGQKAGKASRLDVYVDADSAEVLKTTENVLYGDGNAGWSGPNPVPIQTRKVGSTFEMTMKTAPTMTCQNLTGNVTFTGPDDVWGDGNPATLETGCVDAMYGAQQMKKMMTSWLSREGMNGSNGWLPIRVGLNDQNAFYDGIQIQIGHNSVNQWVSSLDILAHEFGHGVDHHTPGGISRGNTQEFIGDTFGASTEWYDNQPAPFDQRDFLVGEEVNLSGSGEIRNMFDPGAEGDPNCYSATVGNPSLTEVHAAAGPGNHWFYIASQGTNPAGGPASTTCNATTQLGIGITKVMKILYTAMLMKTSSSSYPNYRLWTLIAARHLYGQSTCTEFKRIRSAWDAVSVPPQGGEPTCVKGDPAVKVTNATNRTAVAGTTITPFTMTATGGTTPFTWAATGLPTGLSINASTGQVSGAINKDTAGVWVANVTATNNGGTGNGWFTFQVTSPTSTACSGQRLGNFDFELPSDAPWTAFSGKIGPHGSPTSRTGIKHAWLNGYGTTTNHLGTRIDTLTQAVTVPSGCKATLVFYVWSLTQETTNTTAFDTLTVKAGSTTLLTRSNLNAVKVSSCGGPCPKAYVQVTAVLPPSLSGTTFDLSFTGAEDSSLYTNFHIDDVTLKLSTP